jgi:hypothetical protein
MTFCYVQTELSGEPCNIFDWVHDTRDTLSHLLATHGALRRDRNAVLVVRHLQNWHQRHTEILVLDEECHLIG